MKSSTYFVDNIEYLKFLSDQNKSSR